MADHVSPSSGKGIGDGRPPRITRTLAILLMLAGVAAFVYSRVAFEDQIGCLVGSTLVTFAGLAVLVYARRSNQGAAGGNAQGGSSPAQVQAPGRTPVEGIGPGLRRQIPPGLRAAARRPSPLSPAPQIVDQPDLSVPGEKIPVYPGVLVERVIAQLEGQSAQVTVESQREGRGLLNVQPTDGQPASVLILEGGQPVDVADLRALHAMMTSSGSATGYLISTAPFTEQAYDWAAARKIHLVREDELNEFSV